MKHTLNAMDGNWLLHRAYHASKGAPEASRPRVVARQVTSWAFAYALQHQATHFFMGFDGPACFRKKVWPLYKSSRIKMLDGEGRTVPLEEVQKILLSGQPIARIREPIDDCQDETLELLRSYAVPVVRVKEVEADDLLIAAATLIEHPQIRKVVLVAKDKDMLQGLKKGVVQWYPLPGKDVEPVTITFDDLSERLTKYVSPKAADWSPKQFLDYQTLIGDPTDDVPAILSHAKAIAVLNAHGTLGKYFKSKDGEAFYYENQEALMRNRKLVTMRKDALDGIELSAFKYKPPAKLETALAYSPALSKNYSDYCGWLNMSRRSLF